MKKFNLLGFLKISLLLLSANVWAQMPAKLQKLILNQQVEREISEKQTHEYQVTLKAGEFVQTRVLQNGIDIVLSINFSDGGQLAETDAPNAKEGFEILSHIAEKDGNYIIKIKPLEESENSKKGKYIITLSAKHLSSVRDRQIIETEAKFKETVKLNRADKEKLKVGYIEVLALWRKLDDKYWICLVLELIDSPASFEEAINTYKELGDKTNELRVLETVAGKFYDAENWEKSRSFYEKVLVLASARNDKETVKRITNRIQRSKEGIEFENNFRIYREKILQGQKLTDAGKRREALEKFLEAAEFCREIPKMQRLAIHTYEIIGQTYIDLQETENARKIYKTALDYARKLSLTGYEIAYVENLQRIDRELSSSQTKVEPVIQTGHTAEVWAINFSPNGKILASGGFDKKVKLWEVKSGKEMRTLSAHSGIVRAVAFNPLENMLATGDDDGIIILWNPITGAKLGAISVIRTTSIFDPSYDGLISGRQFGQLAAIRFLTFSPDGKTLASADNSGSIKLWDKETGELIKTLDGHTRAVWSVKFSPNGKILASSSGDGTIRLWDVSDLKKSFLISLNPAHNSAVLSVDFNQNGEILASSGGDGMFKLWDVKNPEKLSLIKEIQAFEKTDEVIRSIDFSPNSQNLIIGDDNGEIKLWNVSEPQYPVAVKTFSEESDSSKDINSVAFSPDGQKIATGKGSNNIDLLEAESLIKLNTFDTIVPEIRQIDFSNNFKYLSVRYGFSQLELWNLENFTEIATGENSFRKSLAFSNDEKKYAITDKDSIKITDTEKNKSYLIQIGNKYGSSVNLGKIVFSPDGEQIAAELEISGKDEIKLWNIDDAKELTLPETKPDWIKFESGFELRTIKGKQVLIYPDEALIKFVDLENGQVILSFYLLPENNWAVVDANGRWDASDGAQKLMYYVLSTPEGYETIDFSQLKQRFYEPNLLKKTIRSEPLTLTKESLGNLNDVPLYPKISPVESSANTRGRPCLVENNLSIELDSQCHRFAFDLQARNGGIGKYILRINDRDVQEFPAPSAAQTLLKQELNIEEYKRYLIPDDNKTSEVEKNKIEIIAYNAEGWLPSRGVNIFYRYEDEKIEPPNLWVLSAGVSDYRGAENGLRDLTFADKDAEAIANALKVAGERLFPQRTNVKLLTSTAKTESERANKYNIKRILTEFDEKAKSTDIVILYLSGHGVAYGSPPNDDFYFLTNEASQADLHDRVLRETTAVSGEEVIKLLTKIPANKQVLILDTCASGKVIEQLTKPRDDATKNYRAWDRMKDRAGLWLLAGSTSDAVSYESSRYGQGVLTYSLLRGMKEDSDRALRKDDDGKFELIDVSTLFEYSRDEVPKLAKGVGGIQKPVIFNRYIENEKKEKTGSFDIGRITPAERAQIELSKEKPAFVRSRFVTKDNQFGEDDLELTKEMNNFLQLELNKGIDSRLAFFQTDEKFPSAFLIKSNYVRTGNEITVNTKVSKYNFNGEFNSDGSEQISETEIGKPLQVTGQIENIPDLMEKILKEIMHRINGE